MSDELIRKYADEIERIIRDNTAGDYTWNGLLFSFLREVDESRTLKYEVENVESDTARTHSVLENVKAPVDEENKSYDVQVYKAGWWDYIRQVSFAYAQSALKDVEDEFETRVIDYDPDRVPNWAPFRVHW